ncbi:hypothetical protein HY310_01525 [Candidatus Microgenomates bacterium]|nr:hypothetical protein [Candidatus Microgenomates bacterium]
MENRVSVENLEEKPGEVAVSVPRVIAKFKSAKIWMSSPHELIIDEHKVTIIRHAFLSPSLTRHIKLTDVANISMVAGPMFGSLSMYEKGFSTDPISVNRFWREDAVRARRLLEGLSVLASQNVKFSELTVDEIILKAEKAGSVIEVV